MPHIYKYYYGTKAGGLKAKATNLREHGKDFYARIGRDGGFAGHTGGFFANPALARIAGSKGGRNSYKGFRAVREDEEGNRYYRHTDTGQMYVRRKGNKSLEPAELVR